MVIAYYATDGPYTGWYFSTAPGGIDTSDERWAEYADADLHGPFSSEEEAACELENWMDSDLHLNVGDFSVAAKHAEETFEADRENYPGNELAKKRFQRAVNCLAEVAGKGNPPAEVVGLSAASTFIWLCAAYPQAGNEVFRRIGNLVRDAHQIPHLELGEEPKYEQ